MFESFIVAFSMYSKIPMPQISWTNKNMKYAICYFPLIGVVIGIISYFSYIGLTKLGMGIVAKSGIMVIIPLIISGGIHMDGFLDTMDAISSYKTKEERLEILKDPHAGVFAIISCCVYLLLAFSMFSEITEKHICFVAIGYVYSRALSGLSLVTFKIGNSKGLVALFSEKSHKNIVKIIMLIYIISCIIIMLNIHLVYGGICSIIGIIILIYYKIMSEKLFNGITGDIAGYFLQIAELAMLIGLVFVKYFLKII